MAKKKDAGVLLSAKEETLNQIVAAQKEKIAALTEYGKKLKKQVKYYKEKEDNLCEDLMTNFNVEFKQAEELHQKVLIISVIGALLFGFCLAMFI